MNTLKMKSNKRLVTILFSVIFLFVIRLADAQENPVILKVAGEEITKKDFLNVYQKNNVNGDVVDRKSLEEYMELYINFRLKVKEAEELGMDTARAFIDELAGYRNQLAQPYLIDEKMNRTLLEEAYNRKKEDIRASHLLIKVEKNAQPADTLAAYKRIMALRKQAIKGDDFGQLAMDHSDDLSARDRTVDKQTIKGNKGDLGYFTVFDMVYPFETGAYNTQLGEISMPVRSDFGYHLIKVTDRKPALGKVQVAHILLRPQPNATAADSAEIANKVQDIYKRISTGEDFARMAEQFSDDKTTSTKGGILPWFGANKMIPEFIKEVSKLKQLNEVSKPFSSSYGWHIVKLLEKKDIGTYEDNLNDLKQNLSRSDRAKKSEEALVNRIKDEYKFTENMKARKEFYKVVNDSIFTAAWDASSAKGMDKTLFTIGRLAITQQDFANWLVKSQRKRAPENINTFVDNMYKSFVTEELLAYEDSQLENKYPEFRSLMQEYRDGILLFELTEQKIWSKAGKDTLGLEAFYEENKKDYMWPQRVDATIYTIDSTDKKITDQVKASIKKGIVGNELLELINNDSTAILTIDRLKAVKGENELTDAVEWKTNATADVVKDGKTMLVMVNEVIAPEPKKLNEARGIITANYQDYLERQWIKELRAKYPYEVNVPVLSSIK